MWMLDSPIEIMSIFFLRTLWADGHLIEFIFDPKTGPAVDRL